MRRETSPQWLNLVLAVLLLAGSAAQDPSCKTLAELLDAADVSETAAWARFVLGDAYTAALAAPYVNITAFAAINPALQAGIKMFTGEPSPFSNKTLSLVSYNLMEGRHTPAQLLAAGSINTVFGVFNEVDALLTFSQDDNGTLLVAGGLEGNVARVLRWQPACRGDLYVLDALPVPTARYEQVEQRGSAGFTGSAFSTLGATQRFLAVFTQGGRCNETVPARVARLPNSTVFSTLWEDTGLVGPLSDDRLAATILVPADAAILGPAQPWWPGSAGANPSDVDVALYHQIPQALCPDELAAAGEVNSMLGVLRNESLPLTFARNASSGELTVAGALGSAVVVVSVVTCHSVILVIDRLLAPPRAGGGAARLAAAPARLPGEANRQITCQPAQFKSLASVRGGGGSGGMSTALVAGLACAGALAAAACVGAWAWRQRRRRRGGGHAKQRRRAPAPYPASTLADAELGSAGEFGTSSQGLLPPKARHTASATDSPLGVADRAAQPSPETSGSALSSSGRGLTLQQVVTSDSPAVDAPAVYTPAPPRAAAAAAADSWELDPNDITVDVDEGGKQVTLGRGSFGCVYRGMLRGIQPAAIKVMTHVGAAAEAAFRQEAAILRHVNRDRNVVQLYGMATLPKTFVLVTELMEGGDLRDALSGGGRAALQWHRGGKGVAMDIARGLASLHANSVIHRDIKSKNVLLAGGGALVAKLADVGLAAIHTHGYLTPKPDSPHVTGTLAWSAPELLMGGRCNDKVDIYSLGIVLWEIATGDVPRRGFTAPPPPSERCPEELAALITACCNIDPAKRPTAREVFERITQIPPVSPD